MAKKHIETPAIPAMAAVWWGAVVAAVLACVVFTQAAAEVAGRLAADHVGEAHESDHARRAQSRPKSASRPYALGSAWCPSVSGSARRSASSRTAI